MMKQVVKKLLAVAMIVSISLSGLTISNANKEVVQGATTDILFIGNSMTYYNELQDIFEALAKKMGKDVNCTAATNGSKNLIYQTTASNVVNAIKKSGYEVVVIQDIVSSFNSGNLMTGAKSIINVIRQYNPNAQIIFYEPWPKENVLLGSGSKLDYFTQGYISAARETGGTLAPAGEAFYDVFVTYGYNYYADGLHPLPMGSFVSASSIYYALYANEGLKTFTSSDLSDLNAVVNVAQGNKKNYTLSEFNNIMAKSYKYARAVAPAVADRSGNTKYTSALYTLEDPSKKVSADLSAYSKINLANASVIDVSSTYNTSNTGNKIIDGNQSTRWESAYSDPQYFTIKLDKTYSMNGIKLFWEGAASRKYVIETSTDNKNWTKVFEQNIGTGGVESIKFDKVTNANYVRLYSSERTTVYGVSLFEVELYGSVASGSVVTPSEPETEAPTEKPTQGPTDSPAQDGTNIAKGKSAVASGAESDGTSAKLAVDGNTGTRFSSNFADNAWIYVDLGATYNVNKVLINWEAAYGKAYNIQVSTDAANWTTVKSLTGQNGGEDVIEFSAAKARYVRIQGVERATAYGYSIWEMEVYATSENSNNSGTGSTGNGSTGNGSSGTTTAGINVANGRNGYTFMTSNANNRTEGFCYVGNGFSAINVCNEALNNGNNMLGKTATTSEVAILVDLGANYDISKAVVYQGSTNSNYFDSYCSNYSVYYSTQQVTASNQGNITWNLAGTCTNGSIYSGAKISKASNVSSTGDVINFAKTCNARSIKIVFDKNSCMGTGTNGGNTGTTGTVSLLSVQIYTGSVNTNTESAVSGTDVALNKTAYQSGAESDGMAAKMAVDGNNGTRFSSNFADNAWMYVDLGATYSINKVFINWEGAYGKAYDIQVSTDGSNWTTVASLKNQNGGEDTITFNATNARYVRMQGVERATIYGYSMWDFKVFAS